MKLKKLFLAIAMLLATSVCLTACATTGVQGAKGDKGDKGEQGIQGEKGDKGVKGDKGDKGDTGDPGKAGTQITVGPNGNWFLDGVDTGVKAP